MKEGQVVSMKQSVFLSRILLSVVVSLTGLMLAQAQTSIGIFNLGVGAPAKPFRTINDANTELNTAPGVALSKENSVFGFYRDVAVEGGITKVESYSVPINFVYNVDNSYGVVSGPITGLMTFTSQYDGLGTGVGSSYTQRLKNILISFTANTPVDGETNLLTIRGTGTFRRGSSSGGSVIGSESVFDIDTVRFTSSFLDFSGSFVINSFSMSFSAIEPGLPTNPNVNTTDNQYLRSFVTNGSGNFSSEPIPPPNRIPEPTTVTLLALGAVAGVLVRRHKK